MRDYLAGSFFGVALVLGVVALAIQMPESTEPLTNGVAVVFASLVIAGLVLFLTRKRLSGQWAALAWPAAVIAAACPPALYLDLHERDRLQVEGKVMLVSLLLATLGMLAAGPSRKA